MMFKVLVRARSCPVTGCIWSCNVHQGWMKTTYLIDQFYPGSPFRVWSNRLVTENNCCIPNPFLKFLLFFFLSYFFFISFSCLVLSPGTSPFTSFHCAIFGFICLRIWVAFFLYLLLSLHFLLPHFSICLFCSLFCSCKFYAFLTQQS